MKNIMKSQLFGLRKDTLSIITFILVAVINIVTFFINQPGVNVSVGLDITGGESVTAGFFPYTLYSQFFLYIFTAQFMGDDFKDKTINYDLMTGHTRAECFFGRAVPCIIISTLGTFILTMLPIILTVINHGWGEKINLSHMILRFFLLLFPYVRITCEYIFLTVLIKNQYIVMAFSYVQFMTLGMNDAVINNYTPILGTTTINSITNVETWLSYGLGSGTEYYVYETAMPAGDIISIIGVSLIFAAGALILGYHFFKKDDMN